MSIPLPFGFVFFLSPNVEVKLKPSALFSRLPALSSRQRRTHISKHSLRERRAAKFLVERSPRGHSTSGVSDEHREVVFSEGNRQEEVVEFPKDTISRVYVDFNDVLPPIWEEEVWFTCVLLHGAAPPVGLIVDVMTCQTFELLLRSTSLDAVLLLFCLCECVCACEY